MIAQGRSGVPKGIVRMTDGAATDAQNADGDHFFCEPRSDSLTSVFRAAASQLLSGAVRLVQLPGS